MLISVYILTLTIFSSYVIFSLFPDINHQQVLGVNFFSYPTVY